MSSKRRNPLLGSLLALVGLTILVGTAVAWYIVRGRDQIAIATLPTPQPQNIPLVDETPTAEAESVIILDEATNPITPIPPTPTIPLLLEEMLATPLPTIDFQELPSEASLSSAPQTLRESRAGHPTRILIPSISVDAPIRDVGLSSFDLGGDIFYQWQVPHSYAVGWHHTSATLGEPGNTVLNGHHNVFGEVFRDLDEIEIGDKIIMYDNGEAYLYTVEVKEILAERGEAIETRKTNANWIKRTTDERITLVSCWPYSDNSHRIVVVAIPEETTNR